MNGFQKCGKNIKKIVAYNHTHTVYMTEIDSHGVKIDCLRRIKNMGDNNSNFFFHGKLKNQENSNKFPKKY